MPIGKLFNLEKGQLQSTKCTPGEYDFITAAEDWKTHNGYNHECEALIFAAAASGSLGRTHYVDGKFISSDLCFILTPKNEEKYPLNLAFYHFVFNSLRPVIVAATKSGTSKESINQTNLKKYELPYFNIEQQDLWIEKLKNTQVRKELLVSELIHQQTLLIKLRQQILQEAIEGKLTADWRQQNPDVEPASELLARIQVEKDQLIKDKKIKQQKPLPPISEEEKPFVLPVGWAWCRLGEIGDATNYSFVDGPFGSSINTSTDYVSKGVPVLRMMNVKPFRFIGSSLKYVQENKYKQFTRHNVLPGDILFSKVGAGIGEACIVPDNFSYGMLATTGITRMRVGQIVANKYLCNFLNANIKNFMKIARQSSQPFLNMTQIRTFHFPLPPLSEQKVIVAKVEKLLALCDQLGTQITTNQNHSDQLMQAVLKEAFTHTSGQT